MATAKRRDAGARHGEGGVNIQILPEGDVHAAEAYFPLRAQRRYYGHEQLCENIKHRPVYPEWHTIRQKRRSVNHRPGIFFLRDIPRHG